MIRRLAVCGVVLMAAVAAQAQEVDCAFVETQQDMNLCAQQDWQTADDGLNAAYALAMILMTKIDADLPVDEQGAVLNLRNAQRSWIAYRDAACAAEAYMMQGGSAQPLLFYGCMARVTLARATDLEQLAQTY